MNQVGVVLAGAAGHTGLADTWMEWALIITGIVNLAAACYALIVVGRSHAMGVIRPGKYGIMLALAAYIALESRWLTRGLYHVATWDPLAWNLMDMIWIVSVTWLTQFGTQTMMSTGRKLMELAQRLDEQTHADH